jgi:hypothetical protein
MHMHRRFSKHPLNKPFQKYAATVNLFKGCLENHRCICIHKGLLIKIVISWNLLFNLRFSYTESKCCNQLTNQWWPVSVSSVPVYRTLLDGALNTYGVKSKSIQWFIEDQAFSLSYDLAPPAPPSTPLPSAKCISFSIFQCVAGQSYR